MTAINPHRRPRCRLCLSMFLSVALATPTPLLAYEWDDPVDITDTAHQTQDPHLASSSDGLTIGAVWTISSNNSSSIAFSSSLDGGNSWSAATTHDNISFLPRTPRLISLDQSESLLLIWIDEQTPGSQLRLAKLSRLGTIASPPQVLGGADSQLYQVISFVEASSNNGEIIEVAALLSDGLQDRLIIHRSEDQAGTWQMSEIPIPTGQRVEDYDLATSSTGDLSVLAWAQRSDSSSQLLYSHSTKTSRAWANARLIDSSSSVSAIKAIAHLDTFTAEFAWVEEPFGASQARARAATANGQFLNQVMIRELGPSSPPSTASMSLIASPTASTLTAVWKGLDGSSILSRIKSIGASEWEATSQITPGNHVTTEIRAVGFSDDPAVKVIWSDENSGGRQWYSSARQNRTSTWSNPAAVTSEAPSTGLLSNATPVVVAAGTGPAVQFAVVATRPIGNAIEVSRAGTLNAWSETAQLSPSGGNPYPPLLGISGDGELQIVAWSDPEALTPGVFTARTDSSGGAWSEPVRVPIESTDATLYSIAVSENGERISALLSGTHSGTSRISIAQSSNAAASWDTPQAIHAFDDLDYPADLASASSLDLGVQSVAWLARSESAERIEWSQSVDGGSVWSEPRLIAGAGSFQFEHLDLRASSSATVQVLSWSGLHLGNRSTRVAISRDGGTSWDTARELSQPSVNVRRQKILISGDGETMLAVWAGWDGSAHRVFTSQSVDAGNSWSTPALRWTSPGGIRSLEASGSDSLSVAAIAIASFPDDQIHLLLGDATSGVWSPSLAASAENEYASTPVVAVSADGERVVAGWYQSSEQQLGQGKFMSSFDGGSTWTASADVKGFYPVTSTFPARTPQLGATASGATLAWACQCPMNNIVRVSRAPVRIEVFTNGFEPEAPALPRR
mgnify:CR=1 FL=1